MNVLKIKFVCLNCRACWWKRFEAEHEITKRILSEHCNPEYIDSKMGGTIADTKTIRCVNCNSKNLRLMERKPIISLECKANPSIWERCQLDYLRIKRWLK